MLQAVYSLFSRNQKTIFLVFSIAILFFLDFDIGFADEVTASQKTVITVNSIYKIIAGIMGIMTAFVSLFLQPERVNGTAIDLDIYMKKIWTFISNVVYFIFAFLLVFIAFVNIIGKGGEKFGLKQALPKFVVGILIVPFTWFFVQFMISLAGVLTIGALTLPYEMFKDKAEDFPVYNFAAQENGDKSLAEATICTKYAIHFGETPPPDGLNPMERANQGARDPIYCKPGGTIKILDILSGKTEDGETVSNVYSIIALYTFGLLGMDKIDNLESADVTEGFVTTIVALGGKVGVGLIFLLVYLVLLIALFFALFIRVVRLWIYIMLSPVFGLMYFLGTKGEGVMAKFNFKEFVSLCMVPVYVSLALSFGFMFMLVASSGLKPADTSDSDKVVPLKIGIIEIEISGSVFETGANMSEEKGQELTAKLFSSKGLGGALGQIIVMLFGIGVFWIAVMAALRSSEITKAVVQPISDFGAQVGKLAASAPMYAPIIPTGKGGPQSMGSLMKAGNLGIQQIQGSQATKASEFSSAYFGGQSRELLNAINDLSIKKENSPDAGRAYQKMVGLLTDDAAMLKATNSNDLIERLGTLFKDNGFQESEYEKLAVGMGINDLAVILGNFENHIDNRQGNALGLEKGVLGGNSIGKGEIKISRDFTSRVNNGGESPSAGDQTNNHEITKITNNINTSILNSTPLSGNVVDTSAIIEGSSIDKELKELLANVNKLPADQKTDDKIHEAITANDFQLKDAQTMDAIKAYIMENKD